MSVTLQGLDQAERSEIAVTIRNAGIAGAGGAGFPAYAKWERIDEVDYLLLNHQESEPNYYIDKWLGRERADEFATVFDALLSGPLELIVVGAKEKDRDRWTGDLEAATDATVYTDEDLPLDPDAEDGVVFAYTDDRYEFGMESVLLRLVADVVVGDDLPMDHGWIVQNTETLYNIYRAFEAGETMTRKFVHVDGNVPRHRFLDVPVGTPAATLLDAAGRSPDDLGDDEVLVDGGPGWCFEIEESPGEFGVTKRTNCVQVLERDVVEENTLGGERINVLGAYEWTGDHETEPTRIDPDYVRLPLITNPAFEGVVTPATPVVGEDEEVAAGEAVAVPGSEGFSNLHHAPIDGAVTAVTDDHVEVRNRSDPGEEAADRGRGIYWTRCSECGRYVPAPETTGTPDPHGYVCSDCRSA